MTSECLECGEPAKHMHPEYSAGIFGDKLCDICMGSYIEDQLEDWIEQLTDHIAETGYEPNETEYKVGGHD